MVGDSGETLRHRNPAGDEAGDRRGSDRSHHRWVSGPRPASNSHAKEPGSILTTASYKFKRADGDFTEKRKAIRVRLHNDFGIPGPGGVLRPGIALPYINYSAIE